MDCSLIATYSHGKLLCSTNSPIGLPTYIPMLTILYHVDSIVDSILGGESSNGSSLLLIYCWSIVHIAIFIYPLVIKHD